ncbi:hypothetical protein [Burkholderia cepacia]|uniref:hypothetical protein n=1 Tax=Burkholderia cepacia TaxID=292 RepID=UPI0026DFAEBB|nr:hypothetical protein [Burkholderia cepacia]MDO5947990.1 hypothetical protein [Burkholderia cepacia]
MMDKANRAVQQVVSGATTKALDALIEWPRHGEAIAGSRWFEGVPSVGIVDREVVWHCPTTGCEGVMKFNGSVWPTGVPGYHHTCTACAFTAAIKGALFGSPDGDGE